MELSTCRTAGMSPGAIPWTAVQQYAEAEGLDSPESYTLHRVIRHMDAVWLDYSHKKGEEMNKTAAHHPKIARPSAGYRGRR